MKNCIYFFLFLIGLVAALPVYGQDNTATKQAKDSTPPEFSGGVPAYMKFLQNNIRYPREAIENDVQGTVILKLLVHADGSLDTAHISVIQELKDGCTEEAIRVIKLSPNWTPGKMDGKNVDSHVQITIRFALKK
jgi:protein TonB